MAHDAVAPATIQAVLFDLDGTLVDSAPDLCGAMNHVLTGRGHPPLALQQVRHLVGNGARTLLARGFWGEEAEPPADDPGFEAAVADFLDYYRDHLTDHSRPYPGVEAALHTLRQRGLALAVVTNKPAALALSMLERLQLREHFARVVGGDTLPQRKPAPEPLQHVLAHLGVAPRQAVMVGDSAVDVEAARATGCPVVLMSHGYRRGVTAWQLHPDGVLDHFEQLPHWLDSAGCTKGDR
ncbi:MAG: phosphoglycolate phosphatase [Magnetococcus sp. DMHC-8]